LAQYGFRFRNQWKKTALRTGNKLPMLEDWRPRLRRELSWLLLLKCGLLAALWACFFSGSHRCQVDASATASRLALTSATSAGDRCD
jgi:hypothetical protein